MSDRLVGILACIAGIMTLGAFYYDGSFDPWLNDAGRAANVVSTKITAPRSAPQRGAARTNASQRADTPRRVYGSSECGTAHSARLARIETKKTTLSDGRLRSEIFVVTDLDAIAVEFSLTGKNIIEPERQPTLYFTGAGRHRLVVLDQNSIEAGSSYNLSWRWRPGATSTGASGQSYRLPFAAGSTFSVSQGFNGSATHTGKSRYAVDFPMPVGTPIHAARGGIVIAACGKHDEGGFEKEYLTKGNSIVIMHSDGSRASYGHLRDAGLEVDVGESVSTGDLIGYSGNTGYSSGPHLHFQVSEVREGLAVHSVPFGFVDAKGNAFKPARGRSYTAGR